MLDVVFAEDRIDPDAAKVVRRLERSGYQAYLVGGCVRDLLLGVESVWLEAECSRYEFFFEVVRQSNPDVAIVALDADQAKALQLIAQLVHDFPQLAILAVRTLRRSRARSSLVATSSRALG